MLWSFLLFFPATDSEVSIFWTYGTLSDGLHFFSHNQPPYGLQITLYEKEAGVFNQPLRVCSLLKLFVSTDRKPDQLSQLLPDLEVFQRQYNFQGVSTICKESTQVYKIWRRVSHLSQDLSICNGKSSPVSNGILGKVSQLQIADNHKRSTDEIGFQPSTNF